MFDFLRFTNFFVLFIRPLKLSLRMATLTHKRPIRPIIASDPKKEKQVCFFCWRRFPYQSALRDHLKTHVVDSRECFCYECNPEQAVAHVEDIYMRYLHIQPKDIDRTSTTYLNRLHHCRLKNFENPVYTCDQCGCAFNGLAVFTKHMQV